MDKDELLEEIRTLLREPQASTVSDPWNYLDIDLLRQISSALRNLRAGGVSSLADVSLDTTTYTLSRNLTEHEGVMISLFVAQRLISGDLVQKLLEGELGIYLNAGGDVIDTKTATVAFRNVAQDYDSRLKVMVAVALASGGTNGQGTAYLIGSRRPRHRHFPACTSYVDDYGYCPRVGSR